MKKRFMITGIFAVVIACESPKYITQQDEQERNKEAREDSAKLALATFERRQIKHVIPAVAETDPVAAGREEDAADDPAIRYNRADPGKSVVFGTNK